jgi:Replication-relaxation
MANSGNPKTTDSLGRATFHHVEPQIGIRPTEREVRWLKHIERHGSQSSTYLHALTCDTHRSKDTSLRQLKKLRATGYLDLPAQQRATAHADFNPYIYDLTRKGRNHLTDIGLDEPTIRPHGHWVHGFMTACASASIDMAATRDGVEYVPGHKILAINDASLAIPIGNRKLIPDQLFALNYGGSFRAFALEADRGTEPKTSQSARKSYASSIELYRSLIDRQLYKAHYGLKANLLVLMVFSSRTNELRFLDLVQNHTGAASGYFMTQVVDCFQDSWKSPPLWSQLYDQPWNRAQGKPALIAKE